MRTHGWRQPALALATLALGLMACQGAPSQSATPSMAPAATALPPPATRVVATAIVPAATPPVPTQAVVAPTLPPGAFRPGAPATATAQMMAAEEAVAASDWYIAAVLLRAVLTDDPANPRARALMQQVAPHAPGGLLYGGQAYSPSAAPAFFPFTDPSPQPIPNWPPGTGQTLGAIGQDGRIAVVCRPHGAQSLDLVSGSLRDHDAACDGFWSPDARYLARVRAWGRAPAARMPDEKLTPITIRDLQSGQTRQIDCAQATDHYSTVYWLADSRHLVAMGPNQRDLRPNERDAENEAVIVVDAVAGSCREITLAGLTFQMRVLLQPDGESLWIAAPGVFSKADRDGQRIVSVFTLPSPHQWDTVLGSPDGTHIYLDGVILNTTSGRHAPFGMVAPGLTDWTGRTLPVRATAWLAGPLPSSAPLTARLSVSPTSGLRGSRFSFRVAGGPPGQTVEWTVTDPAGCAASGRARLDAGGGLEDNLDQDGFGRQIGLNEWSGTYELKATMAGRTETATFVVTDTGALSSRSARDAVCPSPPTVNPIPRMPGPGTPQPPNGRT